MNNSLARLLEIAPAPTEPRQKDWGEAECTLGLELPADYKEFIRIYGGSNWDDYLYVLEPGCPNKHYDLLKENEGRQEDLEDLWEEERKPDELQDEGARVISWAVTDNGESLYWRVLPGHDPDQWTVMINEARGDRWEHFAVSCTQFLASALDGDIESNLLSSYYFPRNPHEFRRLSAV
ncbi:SMI1/KNR4 family protein [Streptomyces sp. NPDC091272]|uniref:SMI1/KNR4 family protein n=1 Tax=Streptomyces sp. NPDC091272 TaxID=3365981 RepID=UPI00382F649A